ncbi:MAG: HTH-type transcriptional regulator ZntR [Candidatus Celerinatantimonas neptuna]|nr:MAG: HTH-type transcriptional regulator ZntR [Candidatus Celerinatantimonas neptuna]
MYRIGELAKLCGVTTETIRFYEREGLMSSPARAENGYRLYSDQAQGRLKFILRGKKAGLSNADMLELVAVRDHRDQVTCRDVKHIVDNKLAIIRVQIEELHRLEASLSHLSDVCCGGDESAAHCSILGALDDLMD